MSIATLQTRSETLGQMIKEKERKIKTAQNQLKYHSAKLTSKRKASLETKIKTLRQQIYNHIDEDNRIRKEIKTLKDKSPKSSNPFAYRSKR